MSVANMRLLATRLGQLDRDEVKEFVAIENLDTLYSIKAFLDDLYFNTEEESPVSDSRYDLFTKLLTERNPDYRMPIGAKIRSGNNATPLPFGLPSLEKVYPEDTKQLKTWLSTEKSDSYTVQDKLDGVSCLVVYKDSKIRMYTRGDGEVGSDITFLRQYLPSIPNLDRNIAVRGELLIKKQVFESKYSKNIKTPASGSTRLYKTARNMIIGLVGSKTSRSGHEDMDFVAYEIVSNSTSQKPSDQLALLKDLGFMVVSHEVISEVSTSILSEAFIRRRRMSEYDMDGLVVQSNREYMRTELSNPEYAFAFKMVLDENVVDVEVIGVNWRVSKWGRLRPRVEYVATDIGGYTNNWATGHNAKFIKNNNIGPGAVIRLTRSGDTIPYIIEVVKLASEPDMPNIPYSWDANQVNVYTESDPDTMCIKMLTFFLGSLGIKHVGQQTVEKMYHAGMDSIIKIVSASRESLYGLPGFQEKLVDRTYTNIQEGLKNVSMARVLGSCGIFGIGIGERKVSALLEGFPTVLTEYKNMTKNQLVDRIKSIDGFSDKTATQIAEGIEEADEFITEFSKYATFKQKISTGNSLEGQTIVFSGTRPSTELRDQIESRKGRITSAVSKKTTILVVKNVNQKMTGKMKEAFDNGARVVSKEQFIEEYID